MEDRLVLTEREIEFRLEKGLSGKMIQYEDIFRNKIIGKFQRLAISTLTNELMVAFQLKTTFLQRIECDLQWFVENIEILYGDTYTGERTDVRRILKGN